MLDGFGGFASSFLEEIREQFPKTPIICFGTLENQITSSKVFFFKKINK